MAYAKSPIIALIGRVNVGKSTLFNRLTESQNALVSPIAKTTRDLHVGWVNWRGRRFQIVDSGGFDAKPKNELDRSVLQHTLDLLTKTSLVIVVIDGQQPFSSDDQRIIRKIRTLPHRPAMIMAVNKIDSPRIRSQIVPEWKPIGVPDVVFVSALNGTGCGDLLDRIVSHSPYQEDQQFERVPSLAIIGKPNVGKSSLVNALAKNRVALVHEQPHTTRDAIDILIHHNQKKLWLIDTAGIRRMSRIRLQPKRGIEQQAVAQSLRAISRSDLIGIMLDLTDPFTHHDYFLIEKVKKTEKPFFIMLNKWDVIASHLSSREDPETHKRLIVKNLMKKFSLLHSIPIIILSAKHSIGLRQFFATVWSIQQSGAIISPQNLQSCFRIFHQDLQKNHPSLAQWILSLRQHPKFPHHFSLQVKRGIAVPDAILNRLKFFIRKQWPFLGRALIISIHKS